MPGQKRYRNISQLNDRILSLKKKIAYQERDIRGSIQEIREDLRPVNLLRKGISSITGNPELRNSAIQAIAGMLINFLAKKYLGGKGGSKAAGLLSTVMENENLREWGASLVSGIFRGKKKNEQASKTD